MRKLRFRDINCLSRRLASRFSPCLWLHILSLFFLSSWDRGKILIQIKGSSTNFMREVVPEGLKGKVTFVCMELGCQKLDEWLLDWIYPADEFGVISLVFFFFFFYIKSEFEWLREKTHFLVLSVPTILFSSDCTHWPVGTLPFL